MNDFFRVNQLSHHLFWDVDSHGLSWDDHSLFIVQRILEYGYYKDFSYLKDKVGMPTILENAKKLRSLDQKTLHFLAAISNTPLDEFRCYTKKQYQKNYIDF
ncbi:MAG: hypothetical protein LAT68_17335 [Cyclobacteriaceae bacterium]|nr:hypothetical protein [Cyclobacteriaceae bacterium]